MRRQAQEERRRQGKEAEREAALRQERESVPEDILSINYDPSTF